MGRTQAREELMLERCAVCVFIEENDDEIMTDAKIRFVELIWDVEPKTFEFASL